MVLLKDLFTLLATGEFSNISLQRTRSGNIDESEYEKVLGHINLGLIEIYKRFNLLEEELILHADPSVETYYLRPRRMELPENISTTNYIERPAGHDGFINIVEIKDVLDELDQSVRLNNRHVTPSVRKISLDTLQIRGLKNPHKFKVIFQAHPSRVILDDELDPDTYLLPISEIVVEPLLYYVASRVYQPMGANNSTANADKSSGYQHQYELACQKIALLGLDVESDEGPDTFTKNGWV